MLSMSHNEGSRQLFCGLNFLLQHFSLSFFQEHLFYPSSSFGDGASVRACVQFCTLCGAAEKDREARDEEGIGRVSGSVDRWVSG